MEIIERLDHEGFTAYLKKYSNTICGRHPIGVFLGAIKVSKLLNKSITFSTRFGALQFEDILWNSVDSCWIAKEISKELLRNIQWEKQLLLPNLELKLILWNYAFLTSIKAFSKRPDISFKYLFIFEMQKSINFHLARY